MNVVEKINSEEMTEDEFWFVTLEFAKVVVEKARRMFKTKEKYDNYIIEYYTRCSTNPTSNLYSSYSKFKTNNFQTFYLTGHNHFALK